jgi:hypothetical protein
MLWQKHGRLLTAVKIKRGPGDILPALFSRPAIPEAFFVFRLLGR